MPDILLGYGALIDRYLSRAVGCKLMTASLLSPPALPEGAAVKLIDGVHTTHGRLFRPFRSNSYPSSPLHFLIDTSQNLRVNGLAKRGDWPPYYDYPSSQRDQFMMLVASLSVAPIPKDPSAAWLDHEAARLRHIKQRYSFTMLSLHCCLLRESFTDIWTLAGATQSIQGFHSYRVHVSTGMVRSLVLGLFKWTYLSISLPRVF